MFSKTYAEAQKLVDQLSYKGY